MCPNVVCTNASTSDSRRVWPRFKCCPLHLQWIRRPPCRCPLAQAERLTSAIAQRHVTRRNLAQMGGQDTRHARCLVCLRRDGVFRCANCTAGWASAICQFGNDGPASIAFPGAYRDQYSAGQAQTSLRRLQSKQFRLFVRIAPWNVKLYAATFLTLSSIVASPLSTRETRPPKASAGGCSRLRSSA